MFQGMKIAVALMQENKAMGMHTCIADCNDTGVCCIIAKRFDISHAIQKVGTHCIKSNE